MLPQDNRLKKTAEIELVKKDGKFFDSQNFKLLILDRKDDNPPRFAFVVSTFVSKNAVDRNKATRGFRQGVRQNLYVMKNGFDAVFIAKPGILKVYTEDLMKEVKQSLLKAKLLK